MNSLWSFYALSCSYSAPNSVSNPQTHSPCAGFMLHQLPQSFLASECVFWTVLFPPELCVYKSSNILEPICWLHAVLQTAKIKMCRIAQKHFRSAPVEISLSLEHWRMSTGPQLKEFPSSI